MLERFVEEFQKSNHIKFRVEKEIEKEVAGYLSGRKILLFRLTVWLLKKRCHSIKYGLTQDQRAMVKTNLSDYVTKSDLKGATEADTFNLASLDRSWSR